MIEGSHDLDRRPWARAALALTALVVVTACQPTNQSGTTPEDAAPPAVPVVKTLARELTETAPSNDAKGCWAEMKAPAQVETVTKQVQVVPEERDPKTGEITRPAIYREQQAQRLIEPKGARYFQSMCSSDMTPAFVAMLQRALSARSLYSGAADGKLDPATGAAIAAYQRPRGLDSPVLSLRAAQELGLYIWTN